MAFYMQYLLVSLLFPLFLIHLTLGFQTSAVKSARLMPSSNSLHPSLKSQRHQNKIMGALFSKTESLSETTKNEYSNKSILLTGASRGLGRSLAHALSTCNPSLLILSGRDEKALEQVKNECLQIHGKTGNDGMRVECIPADLASKSSVEELATKSLQLSQIDVLINNGGISSRSSFVDTRLEVDELLMQVNFFSGVALAKSVVPGMVSNDGGRIVWISSVQGKVGTPFRTSYAASKFAVQGYTEALRSELAPSNISVHVVSPGYVRTNLSLSAVMGDGGGYGKMDDTTANGADPDEVANEILTSVAQDKTDFVVAATFSAKAALWLKFLAPAFLERQLVKRFEKARDEMKKES